MNNNNVLEVLPHQPATKTMLAVYRDTLAPDFARLTNAELIEIACNADARKASFFRHLITLNLVEI